MSVVALCGSVSNTWLPEDPEDLCPAQTGRLPGGVWHDEEAVRKVETQRTRGQEDMTWIHDRPRPVVDGARGSKGADNTGTEGWAP